MELQRRRERREEEEEEEEGGGQALGDDGFVFSLPVCGAQTPPPRPHSPSHSLSRDMEKLNRDTY